MEKLTADISIFELQLFVGASRLRSLRELSRQLDLKPAHVSKVLKRLESKLDTQLFKRSVSGVNLTREGMELLSKAEEICNLASEISVGGSHRGKQRQDRQQIVGTGSVSFLSRYLLAPATAVINQTRPEIRFRILECGNDDLVANGLNGAFEIAVHTGPLQWTRVWESKPLGKMRWALHGRNNHPLGKTTTEAAVLEFPFVVPSYWTPQGVVTGQDYCPVPWRQRLLGTETGTAEAALQLVRLTNQLTFIPQLVAQRAVEAGEVSRIAVEGWPDVARELFISVKSDVISQPLLKLFITTLKQHIT